jgi:hypothetical protein
MSRGISPQKAFMTGRVLEALQNADELEGMEVRRGADRSTLILSIPSAVGPPTEYSIIIREMMS